MRTSVLLHRLSLHLVSLPFNMLLHSCQCIFKFCSLSQQKYTHYMHLAVPSCLNPCMKIQHYLHYHVVISVCCPPTSVSQLLIPPVAMNSLICSSAKLPSCTLRQNWPHPLIASVAPAVGRRLRSMDLNQFNYEFKATEWKPTLEGKV